MSYAIRFLPADPADPSPSVFMSTEAPLRDGPAANAARLTTLAGDVETFGTITGAKWAARFWECVGERCRRDRLRADVVPLAEALADCRDVEVRP